MVYHEGSTPFGHTTAISCICVRMVELEDMPALEAGANSVRVRLSLRTLHADIAQLVVQLICNQ